MIILGAGFAGLNAAKTLGSADADVTIIDRNNHHTFHPLLYQVALAVLSPGDIAQPIRSILSNHNNVEVLMEEACQIDVVAQTVGLKTGTRLPYDFLIVATGSTHSYFGKDEWSRIAPGLKTIEDATEIRRRVLLAYELAERLDGRDRRPHPAEICHHWRRSARALNLPEQSPISRISTCCEISGISTHHQQRSASSKVRPLFWQRIQRNSAKKPYNNSKP